VDLFGTQGEGTRRVRSKTVYGQEERGGVDVHGMAFVITQVYDPSKIGIYHLSMNGPKG